MPGKMRQPRKKYTRSKRAQKAGDCGNNANVEKSIWRSEKVGEGQKEPKGENLKTLPGGGAGEKSLSRLEETTDSGNLLS